MGLGKTVWPGADLPRWCRRHRQRRTGRHRSADRRAARPVPRRRADQRRAKLGDRGGAVRARAERRGGARHARSVGARDRGDRRPPTSSSRHTRCSGSTATLTDRCPWGALILDEAQYVKNHRGKTYRCARELRAPFKLAITGTPMENNLMELWALLSITAPGLFPDPVRFAEHFARPIERRQRPRADDAPAPADQAAAQAANEGAGGGRASGRSRNRRSTVELHPRHRKLYDTHLQRERAEGPAAAGRPRSQPLHDPDSRSRGCAS